MNTGGTGEGSKLDRKGSGKESAETQPERSRELGPHEVADLGPEIISTLLWNPYDTRYDNNKEGSRRQRSMEYAKLSHEMHQNPGHLTVIGSFGEDGSIEGLLVVDMDTSKKEARVRFVWTAQKGSEQKEAIARMLGDAQLSLERRGYTHLDVPVSEAPGKALHKAAEEADLKPFVRRVSKEESSEAVPDEVPSTEAASDEGSSEGEERTNE